MLTSWNAGMGGVIGLRWEVYPVMARIHGLPRAQWRDTMHCIQVMEAEALRVLNKPRK